MNGADEYCFLWLNWGSTCMSKAELASWVRAIRSLIALGLTLHFAWPGQRLRQMAATRARAALLFACRLDLAVNKILQATAWQVKT